MTRSRRELPTLDYSFRPGPPRRWRWLALALALIVLIAVALWVWLVFPAASSSPDPLPLTSQTPAATATVLAMVIPSRAATHTPGVSSTPVAQVTAAPSHTPETASGDIDVDEVEAPWSEQVTAQGVTTYTVEEGDTLWGIAAKFGLEVDTLRWSNPDLERNPDMLSVGTELAILPVKGVYHLVEAGDTVSKLAARYGVAEIDITGFPSNRLSSPDDLKVGQKLIVPHGRKSLAQSMPQPVDDGSLAWPLIGVITQQYNGGHRAIDIGAPYGSSVYASAAGTVTHAGWARTGYGFTVIIDHGDGLSTLYSHMKGALVRVGDWVEQGQVIGAVGSTGNSSGPHVHFEVRVDGDREDPVAHLPPGEPH